MKKFNFLIYLILLIPNAVLGEPVEIYTISKLDDYRGYCLDIKGYKSKANINQGLQAHTCYSYQGSIAVDQGFDPLRLTNNEFFLPEFNVCMEAKSLSPSAPLGLRKCSKSKQQQFKWDLSGRIHTTNENTLCLTIGQGDPQTGGGGSPIHLKRKLTLERCSNTLKPYQIWNTRKSN